ncbi:MAG: DUF692 domain-containing protein [Gammaproteobacteria bacterium]
MTPTYKVSGAGLGLRRTHMSSLRSEIPTGLDFLEAAPENWIGVGGRLGHAFKDIASQLPLVCHGLLLNLGGPDPLDWAFLKRLKQFLHDHNAVIYGDHLTFCASHGHLYELLPIPFTEEAITHVAGRIREVQDFLGQQIAVENASYYLKLSNEIDELDFIRAVIEEADCGLLLDVNNIYVNSVNHNYDPETFLTQLPGERIAYAHIAGHAHDDLDLVVDTHGADVIERVWQLLEVAYREFGVFPTLLERDLNIPELPDILPEVEKIKHIQQQAAHKRYVAA